ncbi:hypothetical protein [Bacillus horti]|uniref:Cellulose synthase/poly-beta-1,6-N-acetylglucosamine synthase-like glycosyltransferase n=1 Tax=Caldalkalibacillus horti TaxID=77523 RepID=A0ABT9W1G8_9BACI|nr:hypothetical protein [Bacillus horti]MDQ0167094.1 cellulose synthase/poly-beta-1,6-N-acetylglucosamine synthase-like glycosyltransferase [Bacillus horti]
MKINNKSLIGLGLILLGIILFIYSGNIFTVIGGVALLFAMYFGYKMYREAATDGVKILGAIIVVIGAVFLISMSPLLIVLALSLICVYLGWRLIKRNDDSDFHSSHRDDRSSGPIIEVEKPFDSNSRDSK